jgi:hypothetical protein
MTPIAIILAALSSYHGTPNQCLQVQSALVEFELIYRSTPELLVLGDIDSDIATLKKFYKTCEKHNPKPKKRTQ